MSDFESAAGTLEKATDLGKTPNAVVRRWLLELKLADKREKNWREESQKVLDLYRLKKRKANSYNILWANTETLRPAIYNSVPTPDVRRRYKDEDPLGKAVSQVLERGLDYCINTYDFDAVIKNDVLTMLLPGRAVSRVRYIPTITQSPEDEISESMEGDNEELEWEQVVAENIQFDDLRIGPGKVWDEIPWIAFRHRLNRDDLEDKFGNIGKEIPLDNTDDEDIKSNSNDIVSDIFKTAEIWEIWDKEEKKVLFIAPSYKIKPVQTLDDPLKLIGFWPIPRPLYAIEDSSTLVPQMLFEQYREQAEELNRISKRINKLIEGLKLRGIYDATIVEMSQLMEGDDNDLIASQGVTALIERGGLEKSRQPALGVSAGQKSFRAGSDGQELVRDAGG